MQLRDKFRTITGGFRAYLAWLLLIPAMLSPGCDRQPMTLGDDERMAVVSAVDSAMKAFESAQRARDADAVIALFAPDFSMYTDGTSQARDSISASIRRTFKIFRQVEPGFFDINIRPMSETSALAAFRFRDSLVTVDGTVRRFTGATTLLWERRDGRWLMTYGHADHRQVE